MRDQDDDNRQARDRQAAQADGQRPAPAAVPPRRAPPAAGTGARAGAGPIISRAGPVGPAPARPAPSAGRAPPAPGQAAAGVSAETPARPHPAGRPHRPAGRTPAGRAALWPGRAVPAPGRPAPPAPSQRRQPSWSRGRPPRPARLRRPPRWPAAPRAGRTTCRIAGPAVAASRIRGRSPPAPPGRARIPPSWRPPRNHRFTHGSVNTCRRPGDPVTVWL